MTKYALYSNYERVVTAAVVATESGFMRDFLPIVTAL